MEMLSVKDLTFTYPNADKPAVHNVDLKVDEGEFIVLCGKTGSGKSTFLRLLKEELRPLGNMQGDISNKTCRRIGFVMQNPKEQAVTDKVWHELVFGMENYGIPQDKMASRAAELSAYFGIEAWYDKSVNELSGGQLQLLNLASVMATDPDMLILDEPTAQLDPIAAQDFISAVVRLHTDFAITVLIAEHRLDELLPVSDRMLVMDDGRITYDGTPEEVIRSIDASSEIFGALPAPYRFFKMLDDDRNRSNSANGKGKDNGNGNGNGCPITIGGGRSFLKSYIDRQPKNELQNVIKKDHTGSSSKNEKIVSVPKEKHIPVLELKQVYFRYGRDMQDVLDGFDLTVYDGEIYCLLGGNGSGKTTALNAAAGLIKPYSGTVKLFSKKLKEYKNQSLYNRCLAMLPQDVRTLFMYNTVREELQSMLGYDIFKDVDIGKKTGDNSVLLQGAKSMTSPDLMKDSGDMKKAGSMKSSELMASSDLMTSPEPMISSETMTGSEPMKSILAYLSGLADKHPYDLSGGEQQLVGLAKVLAAEPKVLLLDEPTKGMDAGKKAEFAQMIRKLKKSGITCVIVTHDVEFAAICADRCGLCFRGRIVSEGEPDRFFADNRYYTTAACRMSRGICEGAATIEGLAEKIR
ncbi:MAG: ATP-binding cassette domain-containing protein [Lachnospiraceae bacterium]|nr:ATP-binding cassette domain-containing protein [Lachnospiraceae bacterium]